MSRSAPLVLSRKVFAADMLGLEHPPSRPLSCSSRRTIGVNRSDDANKALSELRFDTHLADAPALSRLTLGGTGVRYMSILAIDYKLIVLESRLPLPNTNRSHPSSQVYLLYDAVEQSITMIPSYPWSRAPGEMRRTAFAMGVLIARAPGGGEGRRYALVNMVETTIHSGDNHRTVHKRDVLYVWRSWSPHRRWDPITTRFPAEFKGDNVGHSYMTVLPFTCGGRAFWVNLLRGAMYCSLDALLSASNELDFGFIGLPAELPGEIPGDRMCAYEMNSHMFRTMGRAGESSVKFVTIDGFLQHLDFVDCTLKVWSLISPQNGMMTRWSTERSLCLGSLANQRSFKKAGLPTDMVPMYPSLNPEEDDVVYFMLGKYEMCCNRHSKSKERCNGHVTTAKNPLYHLRVDMRRGLLLAAARFPDKTSPSVILADTSVLPSPIVQRESTAGRKRKRRRRAALTESLKDTT